MFGKTRDGLPEEFKAPAPTPTQPVRFPPKPAVEALENGNEISAISAGMTIVGKIIGSGTVKVFGRIQGELHASTVVIADGADIEGDVVAEELTVGGHVKGTIRANRVRLVSTASVEGDIFHRSLAIEEHARFEGSSRRDESAADAARVPFVRSQTIAHTLSSDSGRKLNGAPEGEPLDTSAAD
jgi:cytoskeletal protein CcmA (bactofilin family)